MVDSSLPHDAEPSQPDADGADRRKRSKKSTNKEMRERVLLVAQMLARRLHKHEIKKIMKEKYGVCGRQVATYCSRARQYLIERSKRPREQHISEAFAFFENIIRDPSAQISQKMQAQVALIDLLGLAAPAKYCQTNLAGDKEAETIDSAIKSLSTDELLVLSKVRQKTMAARASEQAGNPN